MDLYHAVVNVLRMSLLLAGSVVIFSGIARAALEALQAGSGRPLARRRTSRMALPVVCWGRTSGQQSLRISLLNPRKHAYFRR